jgi:O-antigen ligase
LQIPVHYYSSGRLSQHLLWLASVMGVVGLLAARFMVALAPVAGVIAVLANPQLRRNASQYFRNGAAMRAAAIVCFLLVSSLYTTEWPTWRHEVFRSLPWLAVPMAFTLAVPLTTRQRRTVGLLFVLGVTAVALATLGKYILNPVEANEAIRVGKNMQAVTRVFHITFGVMMAQAFFWGLILRQMSPTKPVVRYALLAAAGALAFILHMLAYRTGLLVFYTSLLAVAGWMLLRRRSRLLGLGLLAFIILGPYLAYQTLESVRMRVGSTIWDLEQFAQGQDLNAYSLSRRMTAAEAAWTIIGQHWLLGVGPADTHAAMWEQYSWHDFGLQKANWIDVHNQYLEAMLGGGIVGLALWLAVLFWPLAQPAMRRNPAVCFFILTQATVMMVADMLSLQIGLNLFIFGYGFLVVSTEARINRLRQRAAQPATAA